MERVHFIEHKGKRILFIDISNAAKEELFDAISKAKAIIEQEPMESVLTLTDTRNTSFDSEVSARLKEYVAHNKPYVKAAAVIGITGLQRVLYTSAVVITGRKLKIFDDYESAKDWLTDEG